MPRNGSGGYALPTGINPVVTQTLITSNWANVTLADVAAALTQSISKDGQTTPTANLPMGGFRHTGCGDPVLRDNYATLGYVQDGSHYEITNVAGNNAISGTLAGGQTAYSLGMIVQLQPVATSTGPVTLNINGIGSKPVVSGVGNQIGTGKLLVGKAYMMMYNGAAFELITGSDSSAFAQAAMSGWDRPTPSGAYPQITQVNATTVAVPAGTGRIIAPSTRDVSGSTEVSWSAQNVVLTNLTQWVTILGVNASGTIDQLTGNALPSAARDHIILGSIAHVGGAITSIRTRPAIYGDMTYAAYDLSLVFNNLLLSGGRITANAGNTLHMDIAAGVLWQLGGAPDAVTGPNIVPFTGQTDISFYPVTGNSTSGAVTQLAPIVNYDPLGAGTVTAIPGGAGVAVIHRLYLMSGTLIWLYGQNNYTDLATAIANIGVDTATLKIPSLLNNASLISLIIATKGCTDLGNTATARIVPQGGTSYSIGTAGSISEAPVDGSSYGRKNTAWAKVVDGVIAGDGVTVDATNPNKPIVAVGATMAGPKTITSGNLNLSATSNIVYNSTAFQVIGVSVDGADNQILSLISAGAKGATRGAFIDLFGNEAAGSPGQVNISSGNSAQINLSGGNVSVPNGDILTGAASNLVYSNAIYQIRGTSVDGTDTQRIEILSAGGIGTARGASLAMYGNEAAGFPGQAFITAGVGGVINLNNGDVALNTGRLYGLALHNNATALTGAVNQYVGSGTYTPTLTNGANAGTLGPYVSQYSRVGNVVTVSGRLDVTPTAAAGTLTSIGVSFPIASNIDIFARCSGAATLGSNPTVAVSITGDVANKRAVFSFYSNVTVSTALVYSFTYLVM